MLPSLHPPHGSLCMFSSAHLCCCELDELEFIPVSVRLPSPDLQPTDLPTPPPYFHPGMGKTTFSLHVTLHLAEVSSRLLCQLCSKSNHSTWKLRWSCWCPRPWQHPGADPSWVPCVQALCLPRVQGASGGGLREVMLQCRVSFPLQSQIAYAFIPPAGAREARPLPCLERPPFSFEKDPSGWLAPEVQARHACIFAMNNDVNRVITI